MTLTEKFEKNIDQVNSDFQAIKSKLIECGVEVADGTKTAELAEKVGEVFEVGRKAENDAFWDAYQENGNRVNYRGAFGSSGWNRETFKPKYDIVPTNANYVTNMFRYAGNIDLAGAIENAGIKFDINISNTFNNLFGESAVDNIPPLDWRGKSINSAFSSWYGITIQKLIVDENTKYSSVFNYASKFVNLTIEGTIGQNGFDVHWSTKLSKASILSILNALSTTTSGLIVTFSGAAVDKAFETSPGANDGRYSQWWDEWTTYPPSEGEFRGNWTFDLA